MPTPSLHRDSSASLPLFAFGSLMDAELLSVVIGRSVDSLEMEPASLTGFFRNRAWDEVFPILVPHFQACETAAEATVGGVLIGGLSDTDLDRILFFEGTGYALRPLTVVTGPDGDRRRTRARVFLSTGLLQDSGEPWHLGSWQRTEKDYALLIAEELMSLYGLCSAADLEGAPWEAMKARCLARLDDRAGKVRTAVGG